MSQPASTKKELRVRQSWRSLVTRPVSQTHTGACQTNLICKRVHHMAREQLEEKDADAIDIFPLGEITCVGRFGGLILPATSRFVTLVYDLAVIAFTSQCFRLKSPNQETLTRISLISGGGLLVLTLEFRLAVQQRV